MAKQLMLQFGDVLPFIRNRRQEDARGATLRQIYEILSDPQANAQLRVELAATVDAEKPMVESTYILEGDGTLAWKCYCTYKTVSTPPIFLMLLQFLGNFQVASHY